MEQCGKCPDYRNGEGSKRCLKCEWYRKFKMKFTPRQQITCDHLPEMLMESFPADEPEYPEVKALVSHLPDDLAAVVALRYYASRTWESIAETLHISIATATRRNGQALTLLRRFMVEK